LKVKELPILLTFVKMSSYCRDGKCYEKYGENMTILSNQNKNLQFDIFIEIKCLRYGRIARIHTFSDDLKVKELPIL